MSETVEVRIAVAVDSEGSWCAFGVHGREPDNDFFAEYGIVDDLVPGEARFIIKKELRLPEIVEVEGTAEEVDG